MNHILNKRQIVQSSLVRTSYRPMLRTTLTILSLAVLSACSQNSEIASSDQTPSQAVTEQANKSMDVVANAPAPSPVEEPVMVEMMAQDAPSYASKSASLIRSMPTPQSTENYADIKRNAVNSTKEQAFATLSIDTDTGSYANVRRFLNQGSLPPADAVRVEELINYFNYDFKNASKQDNAPFLVSTEVVVAPWKPTNRIVKVGIKAEDITDKQAKQPPSNLVFMVDVSGSMSANDKLQLAKSSLKMLTKQLQSQDTITLITYAGNTEVVLPPTSGDKIQKILNAIDNLNSGGSTNGEAAIKLAYQQAKESYKDNGINRILMLTDGDFNVGVSDVADMLDIIRDNRDQGISLSTLGFGQGNYNDHMMEQVADNGNGNYSYIDSLSEAKKVLIDEMSSTFNTVAKDVKIQVEFNPATVSEWRLIGYENRVLAKEDFNNDKIDAGELGAGKSVVALFEITPVGEKGYLSDSRYQQDNKSVTAVNGTKVNELGFLKIRYKAPNGDTSKLISFPIANKTVTASADTNFAMAVAGYGQLLTNSKYVNQFGYADVKRLAETSLSNSRNIKKIDPTGSRQEFVKLVELAEALD